jgi:hypothetical protein
MDSAMMAPTEQCKIRERCRAAMGPMTDVMALAEPDSTTGEAAAAVAMLKRASQRWRDCSRPSSDLDDASVGIVPHHNAAGVARQALRRSSWNADALFEDRLARRVGVRKNLGIHVDDDLITLPRRARIEVMVKTRLR